MGLRVVCRPRCDGLLRHDRDSASLTVVLCPLSRTPVDHPPIGLQDSEPFLTHDRMTTQRDRSRLRQMKPPTIQCVKDLPSKHNRKNQKAQGNEEQGHVDKDERQPRESDVGQESNAVHRADSGTNDHPEHLRDHKHRETADLQHAMPSSGQPLGEGRPYTTPMRRPSRCDIGNDILWLNDVNGKWVRWSLYFLQKHVG